MKASARLYALMLAAVLALLAALALLAQQAMQARQGALEAQRDSYLLRSLRTTAENYLATGLQLEQMEALQGLIEREHAAFERVTAIDVFSAGGTVLYSTDADSRGTPAPEDWRRRLAQEPGWRSEARMQRQVGQRFDNDLGQASGGIVLTVSMAPAPQTLALWQARAQELVHWLLLGAAAALAATAGLHAGLRRQLRPSDQAARILQGRPVPERPPAAGQTLVEAARQRHEQWTAEHLRCEQAMKALEALDHEG